LLHVPFSVQLLRFCGVSKKNVITSIYFIVTSNSRRILSYRRNDVRGEIDQFFLDCHLYDSVNFQQSDIKRRSATIMRNFRGCQTRRAIEYQCRRNRYHKRSRWNIYKKIFSQYSAGCGSNVASVSRAKTRKRRNGRDGKTEQNSVSEKNYKSVHLPKALK